MYILLCGRPPFDGNTDEEILESVTKGQYSMDSPAWQNVSPEGIELVQSMLKYDPEERITPGEALKHKWIQDLTRNVGKDSVLANGALMDMKNFKAEVKLQQAV
mmetsp:Transcript_19357/g.22536  ORF Transcript_19357/g.22536 Transcript_19357/m.22536 type:complete len:104 (-) Transcript_19357:343-654(-)